jgi:hypothetical protein
LRHGRRITPRFFKPTEPILGPHGERGKLGLQRGESGLKSSLEFVEIASGAVLKMTVVPLLVPGGWPSPTS